MNNLIDSLRDTQKLLGDRLDEIDILSGIVRLLEPSIEKERFFLELAELLFSRTKIQKIKFYNINISEELEPFCQIGAFDNEMSFKKWKIEKGAVEAKKLKEVVYGKETDEEKTVFIPLFFGEQLFGVLSLTYEETSSISQFAQPFYYLLGSINAAAVKIIDEWKRIEGKNEFLTKENKLLKEIITGFGEQENSFIFTSEIMNELIRKVDKVKDLDIDILINGESGTGKDLLARYIHYSSVRKNQPFIAVNCAAIPESLVEGELFGIKEGIATGVKERVGKFQAADKGTIFLDEIGELPLLIQAKLLRFLQEKTITVIGSNTETKVDVRVIAATNRDLLNMVKDGKFREDLYYRLSNFPVYMPALREREEDIVPLFLYFFKFFSKKYGKINLALEKGIEISLKNYKWPGNVREMKNRVLQAVIMVDNNSEVTTKSLGLGEFSGFVKSKTAEISNEQKDNIVQFDSIKDWLESEKIRIEKRAIIEALRKTGGIKARAAEMLDISLRAFHYKCKEYHIEEKDYT